MGGGRAQVGTLLLRLIYKKVATSFYGSRQPDNRRANGLVNTPRGLYDTVTPLVVGRVELQNLRVRLVLFTCIYISSN